MAIMHVATDELNLRSKPDLGNNIIDTLRQGQPVTTNGNADTPGWIKGTAGGKDGFVKASLLREPVSAAREALMAAAVTEWFRFNKGRGEEHRSPYFRYVGQMWQGIGMNLDGQDRDVPWSAAFISWVVRKGGSAYTGFLFAAAHSRYINQAIKARENQSVAPFWGYRPHEHPVQLGDLVCQWRVNQVNYDYAKTHNGFFSHCDVVVEIDGAGVRALGGNNSQTVGFKSYSRNPAGFLKAENNVFAVMKNMT